MKDAKIVKEKMNKKIKKIKKKTLKRSVRLMGLTGLFSLAACGALLYCRLFFKGEVKDKYQMDSDAQPSEAHSNHIVVKTWFGEKDFCVDEETYGKIEVGEKYSFKKETAIDWVKLQNKQKEEKTGELTFETDL